MPEELDGDLNRYLIGVRKKRERHEAPSPHTRKEYKGGQNMEIIIALSLRICSSFCALLWSVGNIFVADNYVKIVNRQPSLFIPLKAGSEINFKSHNSLRIK